MKSLNHTFVVLTILALTSSTWAAEISSGPTVTISGVAGVPGVTMRGLPGAPTTDENGCYTAKVPRGWSGTVIPTKKGYAFSPPQRTYAELQQSFESEDYEPSILTFTISGHVGLAGVSMDGPPGRVVTDSQGNYSATVQYGWIGIVRPFKEGYSFEPPARQYPPVTEDCKDNDHVAQEMIYMISGTAGVPGVLMTGLPGTPVTDENGYYVAKVPHGWTGTVMPAREGYAFHPPQKTYDVVSHACENENYTSELITFTISGNVGLEGVMMEGLPDKVPTDSRGFYVAQVPYGWSGRVVPTKQGCKFRPASREYATVVASQQDQSYTPVRVSVAPSSPYGTGGIEVLVIPSSQVDPKAIGEIREDMQVMVQILREMLSEPRMILGILYDYGDIFGSSDRGTRAFYLEGYGALFVMEVDFPFSFPSEARPEGEPEQEVDPIWQRARQRLRSPGDRRVYGQAPGDEMSFEQFKADLVKTLKHAANIRHVDPNESVILTVIGQDAGGTRSDFSDGGGAFPGHIGRPFEGSSYSASGGSFGPRSGSTYANSYTYSSGSATPGSQVPAKDIYGNVKRDALGKTVYQAQPAPATVLTIRATKADIDAFAAGQIDLEQFQQRVNVLTY